MAKAASLSDYGAGQHNLKKDGGFQNCESILKLPSSGGISTGSG
jgi:hypothetical protein